MKKSLFNLGSYGSGHIVTKWQKKFLPVIKFINNIRWRLFIREAVTKR